MTAASALLALGWNVLEADIRTAWLEETFQQIVVQHETAPRDIGRGALVGFGCPVGPRVQDPHLSSRICPSPHFRPSGPRGGHVTQAGPISAVNHPPRPRRLVQG